VVWWSNLEDIVDRSVNAAQLANYPRQAIQSGNADAVVLDIKRWRQ
jgi:hypothetical protein